MLDPSSPRSQSSKCRSDSDGSKIAPALFNRPDADLVLSSADDTHFRVHRQILSIASPFFGTMFSLPQPQSPAAPPGTLPVVPVEEDARTLENLLRIMYPERDPQLTINVLTDWQHISNITRAALKYDSVKAIDFMKAKLTTGVDSFPLDVFCVACKHRLETVAKSAAARLAVDKPGMLTDYVPLLEDIPAGCYHRLLRVLDNPTEEHDFSLREDSEQTDTIMDSYYRIRDPRDVVPGRHAVQTADKVYYAMSADSFEMFQSSPTPSLEESDSTLVDDASATCIERNDLPLTLSEDSRTIDLLLRAEAGDTTLELLTLGLCAAMKYKADQARRVLAGQWLQYAKAHPLKSYLMATTHGLKDEAISSARQLLTWSPQKLCAAYDPAMEYVSAGHYYRLLQYHETCMKVTSDSMQNLWEKAFPPAISRCCRNPTFSTTCTENNQSRWVARGLRHIQALKRPSHRDIAQDTALVAELCFQAGSCPNCVQSISSADIIVVLSAYVKANEESLKKVDTTILCKST
ncbi:hypothetical protein C8Q72DRAFT_799933 [Fomitopsis betulina]|nr:hypothetical protein C8Q72DRAFT_799933 [Fomitopsis betulina]